MRNTPKKTRAWFGKNLRKARRSKGWSMEQAAERINITTYYYGCVETGRVQPSLDLFIRIVNAMDVSADSLLGIDDTPTPTVRHLALLPPPPPDEQ